MGFPVISDLICVQRREFAELPLHGELPHLLLLPLPPQGCVSEKVLRLPYRHVHMSLGLGKIPVRRIRPSHYGFQIGERSAGHIWKKYHSVTAWCNPFRDLIELVQRRAFFPCYRALIICKLTFKPAHDTTTSGGSS